MAGTYTFGYKSTGVNLIGTAGGPGFGVGVCPPNILPAGMTPMEGYDNPMSDNYGNYQYADGSICCWVPRFYYKFTVNDVDVKGIDTYPSRLMAEADGFGGEEGGRDIELEIAVEPRSRLQMVNEKIVAVRTVFRKLWESFDVLYPAAVQVRADRLVVRVYVEGVEAVRNKNVLEHMFVQRLFPQQTNVLSRNTGAPRLDGDNADTSRSHAVLRGFCGSHPAGPDECPRNGR